MTAFRAILLVLLLDSQCGDAFRVKSQKVPHGGTSSRRPIPSDMHSMVERSASVMSVVKMKGDSDKDLEDDYGPFILEGTFEKMNSRGMFTQWLGKWQPRQVRLYHRALVYATAFNPAVKLTRIPLEADTICSDVEGEEGQFTLSSDSIRNVRRQKTGGQYRFKARSPADARKWTDAIKVEIQKLQHPDSDVESPVGVVEVIDRADTEMSVATSGTSPRVPMTPTSSSHDSGAFTPPIVSQRDVPTSPQDQREDVSAPEKLDDTLKITKAKTNTNEPAKYKWLKDPLEQICNLRASKWWLESVRPTHANVDKNETLVFTPLLFMIGGCPNIASPMQAIMLVLNHEKPAEHEKKVDFWWVKPEAKKPDLLEKETLWFHAGGTHKNDVGTQAAGACAPFANLLMGYVSKDSESKKMPTMHPDNAGWTFGYELAKSSDGTRTSERAILKISETEKLYLVYLWQEDWKAFCFPWKWEKIFAKGKIVYQKRPDELVCYARQFEITHSSEGAQTLRISKAESQGSTSANPLGVPNLQALYELPSK